MLASHLSQLAQHASSLTREEMSASVNAGLILLSGSSVDAARRRG